MVISYLVVNELTVMAECKCKNLIAYKLVV